MSCFRIGTSKAPAKRSQHVNTTYRNIVERNNGHRVAMCCDMLGVVGLSLEMVKFEPTTPNMLQHIATRWPNAHSMLRPTMLRYVTLTRCDRLAGAQGVTTILSHAQKTGYWYLLVVNLVPRPWFSLTSSRKTRALGETILNNKGNSRILVIRFTAQCASIAHASNGCSQSSRFPTAGQGERSPRNEID